METSCSKFWLGLGLGSIIGVVAYRFSCSSKGKMLKEKACHVLHRMGGKAEDMIDSAKGCGSRNKSGRQGRQGNF